MLSFDLHGHSRLCLAHAHTYTQDILWKAFLNLFIFNCTDVYNILEWEINYQGAFLSMLDKYVSYICSALLRLTFYTFKLNLVDNVVGGVRLAAEVLSLINKRIKNGLRKRADDYFIRVWKKNKRTGEE